MNTIAVNFKRFKKNIIKPLWKYEIRNRNQEKRSHNRIHDPQKSKSVIYWKKNDHKSIYYYSSVLLEATGTEKLQGKQNLRYFKNLLL